MSSKKPDVDFAFGNFKSEATNQTERLQKLKKGRRRLFVEVSEPLHERIRARAFKTTITKYVLWVLDTWHHTAKRGEPPFVIEKDKRIVMNVSDEMADLLQERAEEWGSFREFVFRCLEADGMRID